jgi:thiol-disulfide isomerase/thioredoxin
MYDNNMSRVSVEEFGQSLPILKWRLSKFISGLLFVLLFTFNGLCTASAQSEKASSNIPPIDTQRIEALLQDQPYPVILAAMAAWCQPCIAELPILEKLHQKYKASGLKIVGLSLDFDDPNAMLPILKEYKVTFPIFWAGEPGIQKLKIKAIPLLMFIRKGVVVKKLVGAQSQKTIESYTRKILQQ